MREQKMSANGVLIFLIYGMFALFSLLLVVIGARIYRGITVTGEENTTVRTSFSYLANKLRMETETAKEAYLEERDGVTVLVLKGSGQLEEYETLIYYRDGMLWEYFGAAGEDFVPEAGEKLMAAEGFTIEEASPGLLYLELADSSGKCRGLHLSCQSQRMEE